MKLLGIVLCFVCVSFLEASELYTAGVLHFDKEITTNEYTSFVYDAAKKNVDILVLPPFYSSENYDDASGSLSKAAKDAGIYVVAHLYEKARCQNKVEFVKSNLVFDREGSIVAVYRKPVSNLANCTSAPSDLVTFTTDFGVTFGLLMDEDVVLQNKEYFKGLKNFVMTGAVNDATFLNSPQFFSSWSYVNNAYLVSSQGIFMGRGGMKIDTGNLVVADLNKCGGSGESVMPNVPSENVNFEDLRQHIIKPLDLEASGLGYKETVCHGTFCCEFYVKTAGTGLTPDISYGFAVLDGVYPFTASHSIGTQSCMVSACAGMYKRSCEFGFNNSTNIVFQKISITANFTKENAQYPIVQTASSLPNKKFKIVTKTNDISKQITLEIVESQNLLKFGVFGRDFSKDFEVYIVENNNSESTYDIYDYIFNEDVQGFFDYVWIRLRILLVVVSIYVLEMM